MSIFIWNASEKDIIIYVEEKKTTEADEMNLQVKIKGKNGKKKKEKTLFNRNYVFSIIKFTDLFIFFLSSTFHEKYNSTVAAGYFVL